MSILNSMLDFSVKEVPQQSEIKTELVETNNATTDTSKIFKFTIRNVGFLEGTSMLTFKMKNNAGNNGNHRLNIWNGALSCIKNAVLKIGDFEINNCQGVDRIATLLELNQSVLQRRNVMGHYLGNALEVQAATDTTVVVTKSANLQGVGQIEVDSVNSGLNYGAIADGAGKAVNNLSVIDDIKKNERMGIPLNMIFPCLKGRSLPLFLFTDYHIQLEFEMNDTAECMIDLGLKADASTLANYRGVGAYAYNEVQLVIDYVLPPSSVINSYMEQTSKQGGYRFEFPQIAVVKKSLPAVTTAKELQDVEHRLGQTGKEVHSIIQMKRFTDYKIKAQAKALGRKVNQGQVCDGIDDEEYNCEVNGLDIYPDFIYNNASQYNQMKNVLDKDLIVPRPMYYTDPNAQRASLMPMEEGLAGNWKPLGVDLRNGNNQVVGGGTTIDSGSPLVFKYRRRPNQAVAGKNQINFRGQMDVDYYIKHSRVVIVRKLPRGTQVVVSS